jgi:hypothetical protein
MFVGRKVHEGAGVSSKRRFGVMRQMALCLKLPKQCLLLIDRAMAMRLAIS